MPVRIRRGPPGKTALGLRLRITLVFMAIMVLSILLLSYTFGRLLEERIVSEAGERAMSVADQVAVDSRIVDAFGSPDPAALIQPIAERIRAYSGTSFVVVFNMDAVRYSHPVAERIGQRFVGGDEADSLAGKRYLSRAKGTLGPSVRAFVPIRGAAGEQLGVVSVGLLIEDLEKSSRRLRDTLNPAAALSLLIGLVGALALSRDIKKTIFGLEPREIATLLEERDVIISSIKEGIVAVDAENRVILMNDNARRLLAAEDDSAAAATVAGMGLDAIAAGGRSVLDQELALNGKVMLVNRIPLASRGKSIGAVATFRDMSEVRALAEELTAVRQYTEALRAQHHEFLNKLHVVSGLLQLGRHAEASRYVVSTVARKQESFDLLRRSVETPEIAALVLAKMSEAQELGIEVEIEEGSLFPALRPEATDALVVILGNLLQNAVESLKSRERADKSIVIAFAESPEGFVLSVRDNGEGLAPGIRDRLFEKGTTSKDGGRNMGIGLFLVKSRVDELGGRIEALEGEGLEMIVRLDRERIFPSPSGAPSGG